MPTTSRRSGSGTRAAPGKQMRLSFANRVTKPVTLAGKKDIVSPLPTKISLDKEAPLEPEEDEEEAPPAEPARVKSEAELRAEKITTEQINLYWRGIEAQRLAPCVHQEGLDVGEKVLRYFDVSSQFGPCIGSSRLRRWMRAERLGLNPPIEVLAVLAKEETAGNKDTQRAHIDEIMNSTAVGAVDS